MYVGAFVLKIVKIMGAIKDIVDLCIKLRDENRDGKISAAISEIQSLTLSLQSEQVAIAEKNSEFVTENLGLKRKLLEMETSHAQAIIVVQEKHRTEISKIAASNARPKEDRLDETTEKILKYIFEQARDLSAPHIAYVFKMKQGVADFHINELGKKKFIQWCSFGFGGGFGAEPTAPEFSITAEGQGYIVKNGLAVD